MERREALRLEGLGRAKKKGESGKGEENVRERRGEEDPSRDHEGCP